MKFNKRRTPELIAGVLFLSIFFVPCAGVHAEGGFSDEEKASIKSVVAEAIGESGVVTKTELNELKTSVKKLGEQSATVTPLPSTAVPSEKKAESLPLPAWFALWGAAGLGVVCLALLVFVLVLVARMPKKKDDEAEKAKRDAERDSYFNGPFKSLDEKIQKVQTSIGANKPPAASEISGAVKTEVINYIRPKFEALEKKVDKMPQSDEIATEVFGAVSKDLDQVRKFVAETKGYLEETKKVIGGVNQEYGGALKLLEKIQKDQKEHLEKIETDRKVFEQEKQKEQKELAEIRRGLDERAAGLNKRDAKLEQDNAALARKQGDLAAKEKSLDDEKKGLEARIKQAAENARQECRNQFDKEKAALEAKGAQEKAAVEQKCAQEKAAVEQKCAQEKAALTATIGELQKKVDGHDREIESYTNQLKTANEDNLKLKTANENLTKENQKLSLTVEEANRETARLKEENRKIWDEARAKYEPEIQTLKAENDRLSKELGEEKKRNQEMRYKIEDIERKNQALQEENAKLASMLDAAQRRSAELEEEIKHLMAELEELKKESQRLQTELAAARDSVQKSDKIIYPEEFKSDPKFAVLKQHLDEWKDIPESAIVRASLQLFSQRATLKKEDTISLALRDLSFGITQTLSRKNAAPNEIIAELVSWCDFIQGYSDDSFKFNLQVPGLGENYDSTRMTTTKSTDRVHKVLTWMVLIHRKSANPIKKLAEVE